MSALDLTGALDAAARAFAFAAAPLIAAQVREQIAEEIEAHRAIEERRDLTACSSGKFDGLWHAARIARGGAS